MRFSLLNPQRKSARHFGVSLGVSLCAGALFALPSQTSVWASPTLSNDENGPQVQILKPAYQDVLKGRTQIVIAVKGQNSNPQSVEMFVDDKAATDGPIPLSALPSAQFDWPTTHYSDGPHKLTIRVTDAQGFRGEAEVNVYINNNKTRETAPPSLQWQGIEGYQQISGSMKIEVSTLNNFGVKWLMIAVNPASDPNRKPPLRSWFLNKAPFKVDFDSAAVPDGLYSLTAKAWDPLEQEGEAPPLTIGVLNSGALNPTTMGEMLRTMREMQVPKTGGAAPRANSETQRTARVETPRPSVAVPKTTRSSVNPRPAAAQTNPVRTSGNLAGNTTAAQTLQAAKATAPAGAAPRLSTRSAASTAPLASPAQAEASPATKRELFARAAAPEMEMRPFPSASNTAAQSSPNTVAQPSVEQMPATDLGASLSVSGNSPQTRFTGRRELESAEVLESAEAFGANRIAAPTTEMRPIRSEATTGTATSVTAPALSPSIPDDATRLAVNVPLMVEAPEMLPEGRLGNPEELEGIGLKPVESFDIGAPALSTPSSGTSSRLAPRAAIASETKTGLPTPSRVASPESALQILAPSVSVAPSTGLAPRAPRAATNTQTRVAALPRPSKPSFKGAITAIKVSPLEVKTSNAIPAFHSVARATDLRAVAARYGLPVEVIAASNGWKTSKTLAAGDRVKLPTQLKVSYQGVPVESDVPSMLVGGTSVGAFRFVFEKQGGTMTWDAKRRRVVAKKGDSEVTLSIGSNKAKVGDKDVMMELAAFLFEGRTMVPLRFFEAGLNAQVEWDPQSGRLVVAMAG